MTKERGKSLVNDWSPQRVRRRGMCAWELNSWASMKALKLAVRSLVMDSMSAGVVLLMLAAFVVLASADSLPAMPAWPAIQ